MVNLQSVISWLFWLIAIQIVLIYLFTYLLKRALQIDALTKNQQEQICLLKQIKDQEAAIFNNLIDDKKENT